MRRWTIQSVVKGPDTMAAHDNESHAHQWHLEMIQDRPACDGPSAPCLLCDTFPRSVSPSLESASLSWGVVPRATWVTCGRANIP